MHRLFVSLVLGVGSLGLLLVPSPTVQAQNRAPSSKPAKATAGIPATVVVHLPADARLTIDGQATTSTAAERRFVSPPLAAGQDFHYTFKAEFNKDGKKTVAREVVSVRAGRETIVWLGTSPGANETRAFYFAPESQPVTTYYGSTTYPESYSGGAYSLRVLPMSEQDPLNGSGPPGSDDPNSTRTR